MNGWIGDRARVCCVLVKRVARQVFCLQARNWSTVINASAELEKAKNLLDLETAAEWSRLGMATQGNRQWLICDLSDKVQIVNIDMKNFCGDADTIKTVEVYALNPEMEYKEEKEDNNWQM